MDLKQIIDQTIMTAVRQQVTDKVELFVKNEVIKELRRRGVDVRKNARERNNRTLNLVEKRDMRRKVGTLNMTRMKDKVVERIQFTLKGLQARNPRDAINERELNKKIEKELTKYFR